MPTPGTVTVLPSRKPIVEERLRLTLATLDCLARLANLADEPQGVRLFADLKDFARVVGSFARALQVHIRAIKAALPPHCGSLDAPGTEGGVR